MRRGAEAGVAYEDAVLPSAAKSELTGIAHAIPTEEERVAAHVVAVAGDEAGLAEDVAGLGRPQSRERDGHEHAHRARCQPELNCVWF